MNIFPALRVGCLLLLAPVPVGAWATEVYRPITPTLSDTTVMLDGHSLSVEQLVDIARHGAKVKVSAEAMQRAADSFGLMMEAQAEGVPVYKLNRQAGSGREVITMTGDPDSPENIMKLAERHAHPSGGSGGFRDEIADEDVGRAMLAVEANIVTYEAASADFVLGIVELVNRGVTPSIYWRGAIGEADFAPVVAVLTGRGFAYYKGVRMPASEALAKAGLKPVQLAGQDEGLSSNSSLTAAMSALLVHDARHVLEWHDLIWAMDLLAINSNLTPLAMPVQAWRPFPWPNYAAARTLDTLKGSYLFNDEYRILQDPESLRATVWRAGTAWKAWAQLRESALIQMNSTDHNPTTRPGVKPEDSWELSTPQMMKYYVKGGKYSNGKGGFIFSNSNWDPYPLAVDIEVFPIALANLMVTVVQRFHRLEDPFFTIINPADILKSTVDGSIGAGGMSSTAGGGAYVDGLWQELKPLINPIAPDGVVADKGVGDIDAVPVAKLMRARQALVIANDMLGQDLLNATFWLDVRKLEKPDRHFGGAVTAAWGDFRKIIPFQRQPSVAADIPRELGDKASEYVIGNDPSRFYPSEIVPMPLQDIPFAGLRAAAP